MILHQTLKKERRKGRKHTLSMNDVFVRLAERECQQTEEALERYSKTLKYFFRGEMKMREISTTPVKNGELILVDGEKYVAEEAIGKMCSLCAFHNSYKCESIPCNGVIFKRIKKESHGRCIDAYSLAVKVAEAQEKLKGKEYDPFMLLGDVLRWIELEPTVLESSTSPSGFCNTEGCSNSKPDMSKAQNHICPYYKGVCSLDENILCYCQHHYEMCEKFLKVGKEEKK